MDLVAEVERAFQEMEWADVVSTLEAAIGDLLGDTSIPPPSPPPPLSPPFPPSAAANAQFEINPQPLEHLARGYGGCIPQGAAPCMFEQPSPSMAAPVLNLGQAAPSMQQIPLHAPHDMQSGCMYNEPGVSQGQYNNMSLVGPAENINQYLIPAGFMNGEVVYEIATDAFMPSDFAAPPPKTSISKRRKRAHQQDEDCTYVKKPPNAFMVFRREQRPKVVAELKISNSAVVNAILGQRWKLLSKEEQAKYYQEADNERLLHAQRYPDWSANDTYGKKRKSRKIEFPTTVKTMEPSRCVAGMIEPSTSCFGVMEPSTCLAGMIEPSTTWGGVTEPSVRQTGLIEPSASRVGMMEPSACHAGLIEPSTSETVMWPPQAAAVQPVSNTYYMPYDIYWPSAPAAASTTLMSLATPIDMQTMEFNHLSAHDRAA